MQEDITPIIILIMNALERKKVNAHKKLGEPTREKSSFVRFAKILQ